MERLIPFPGSRSSRWVALALAAAVACLLTSSLRAADEREMQAVFLLNLSRFIRWPDTAFSAEDAPLVIGSLPGNAVGALLKKAAENEFSGRHPIEVREIGSAADLAGCHIVYFPKANVGSSARFIEQLSGIPVLSVSDAEGFLRMGGHIQLHSRGGHFKLRLALENLKKSELSASAPLLRVAEIVPQN